MYVSNLFLEQEELSPSALYKNLLRFTHLFSPSSRTSHPNTCFITLYHLFDTVRFPLNLWDMLELLGLSDYCNRLAAQ